MNIRDKKMAVLRQLSRESEPIGLPELLQKLKEDFQERSVRRWLNLLVEEGVVQKSGQKRGTKYLAIKNGTVDRPKKVSSCFSSASERIVQKIRRPLFEREPVPYEEDWFNAYQPNETFYFSKKVRKQLFEAGKRAHEQDPAGTYAHRIFNRLLIDLSYNSSRLEGNTYSLLDTERLVLHGDSAEGKLEDEKMMILNHKEAIRYLVDNAPRLEVTSNVIFTLHYLLADGLVEPQYAGKVRNHAVRIGGSTYNPFENPKKLEKQLNAIAAKGQQIKDPFEQSLFLLVHISYLQAFADVNKRTARLAANISLIKGNLVPLAFNDVRVEDYMSAMISIYELQNVQPLIDLFVYSYLRTCAAYDSTVKAMGFDEVRVRFRQKRREILRHIILNGLTKQRIDRFVQEEARIIPEADRELFVEDIFEDLELMDESRLAGLGVTPQQLGEWLNKVR